MADNKSTKGSQETPTLDEQINEVLATADDKGQLTFGDDVDPVFKKLVLTEKKARNHQAKAIKSIQEVTSLKATNDVLTKSIKSSTQLTAEQVEELEGLKFTDPDAWHSKKLQYEGEAAKVSDNKLNELTSAAAEKALKDLTLTERKEAVASFVVRTGIELTDDVMENDIPPRLKNKLGVIPFEEYLDEVAKYLGKGKVVKQTDAGLGEVNIGNLAGGEIIKEAKSNTRYQVL